MRIVISSGHGLYVRGAVGLIDEVDEARRVVDRVAELLTRKGHDVVVFHDDTSTNQSENLNTIVAFHNSQDRDVDVSVHFNAYIPGPEPKGTECLYVTQDALATRVAEAVSVSGGLINRGPKYRSDLAFLNGCAEPAILIETCFVDSEADVEAYQAHFEDICAALADLPMEAPRTEVYFEGKCSWFGGPQDMGVAPDEGLAFFYDYEDAPHLFLDDQPDGTSGLARRLNPQKRYVACRWDYDVTPKSMLASDTRQALVRSRRTGREVLAYPADWGPHSDTDRAADVSPGVMDLLGIETDDEVEVFYPVPQRRDA